MKNLAAMKYLKEVVTASGGLSFDLSAGNLLLVDSL